MRTGKLSDTALKRSVLRQCAEEDEELVQGAGVGKDSAVIRLQGRQLLSCVSSPAVIDRKSRIRLTLEHTMNSLVCSGCLPQYVLLTVLLPPEAEERQLKELMREAAAACERLQVKIAGGHTEVTDAVRCPLFTVTAFGFSRQEGQMRAARPGMALLLGGHIALEGTALLLEEREAALKERFSAAFLQQARDVSKEIYVGGMAQAALGLGAAALHDASCGGIFGALWEFCEREHVGLRADLRRIPVRQETIEICEYLGRNPYTLLSGGTLLFASEDGKAMEGALRERGILAAVIGELTAGNDRILQNGEEIRYLDRPAQDEIWKGNR